METLLISVGLGIAAMGLIALLALMTDTRKGPNR
jgi:hypothetical protein